MTTLKPRKQLTELQQEILEILYKFRFATIELIGKYQELESTVYTYKRLKLLEAKKLIGRKYDGNYRIHGKSATYYLLKDGIKKLKTDPDFSTTALNGMYKDGTVKDKFIEECLSIFQLYVKFVEIYGETMSFNTKNEITESDYFPRPLPDAYITLKPKNGDTKQYMLEILEDTPRFSKNRSRIFRYIVHYKDKDSTEQKGYPTILLVCENSYLERRVQRQTARTMDQEEIIGLTINTTTTKALMASNSPKDIIWSDVNDPDELISLL